MTSARSSRRRRRGEGFLSRVDRRWVVRVLATVAGAFLLGYLFTALVFFPGSRADRVVAVPDLREMDDASARRHLHSLGLEMEVGDSLTNSRVAEGMVLSQTPLPGQEVAPGSPVRVILSAGSARSTVPVVSAMSREQAVRVLEASGFTVGVAEVEDPSPAGRVVGVEPRAGTVLRVPAAVQLRVSSGPPLVRVPDLAGLREDEAAAALEDVGLELGPVEFRFTGLGAQEVVIRQEPSPGSSVPQGSEVRVRISTDRLEGRIIR